MPLIVTIILIELQIFSCSYTLCDMRFNITKIEQITAVIKEVNKELEENYCLKIMS